MTPPEPEARRRMGGLLVDPAPLRHDRDFRLLWAGQAVSTAGQMITTIVLPYQVYVLTGDLLMVGALSLIQLIPILMFALGGGAIADFADRRRMLIAVQLGLVGTSLALVLIALLPEPPVAAIFAVAFAYAGLSAVDQPARGSAVPRLVPAQRLTAAIALNQLMFNASAVVGPAIGGIVLATAGVAAAYAIDAVTFGVAILTLLLMAPIPPAAGAPRPSLTTILEGLRFAARRREVLATFVVDINAMVFGMPRALYPALALDVFGVGPAGVGLMASASGLGALVAAVLSGWTNDVRRPGLAVLGAVAVWSAGIVGFGLATFSFPLALLCLAIAAGADVISAVFRSSIVYRLTPDDLRGRVSSIHVLVVTGGPRVGDAEATAVATLIGPAGSVVAGGLLSLAGVGLISLWLPEFRRLRFPLEAVPVVGATRPGPPGD